MTAAKQPITTRFTAATPCPVCGSGSKGCSATADGLHFCRGDRHDAAEWRQVANDGTYASYRRIDPTHHHSRNPSSKANPAGPKDWRAEAERYAKALTPPLRAELAAALGLPVEAFAALPLLGWRADEGCWTFPECDPAGRVVGITRRFRNGKKMMLAGGNRGLTLPAGWRDKPGPVFVVEGASDALAMAHAGVCGVGRPSNGGGAEMLAELLTGWPAEREIVVLGENDRKADDRWPGRAGAEAVGKALATKLRRPILLAFPPGGAKDVRAWLTDAARGESGWPARGAELSRLLTAAAERIDPPVPTPSMALNTRRMDEVVAAPVNWLWHGRLPLGMLTILDGDPALGKSTIAIDVAARLSSGRPFPGSCDPTTAEAVAFLCSEDSAEHTVRPRLEAAGADLTRCHVIDTVSTGDTARPIILPADLPFIEAFSAANGVKLIVIDPLFGFVAAELDSHKDHSIRAVLHAIKLTAERTGAAVLALRHLNKGNGGAALYRGGGSIAITAQARVVLSVGRNPNRQDERLLAVAKSNLAKTPKALAYDLEAVAVGPSEVSRVAWGQESDLTADDIVTRPTPDGGKGAALVEAEAFLRDELAAGPVPSDELTSRAEAKGIAKRTLYRAKEAVGVKASKGGFSGGWRWELPAEGGRPVAEGGRDAPTASTWPSSQKSVDFAEGGQDGQPPATWPHSEPPARQRTGRTPPPTDDIETMLRRVGWTWEQVGEWFDRRGDFFDPAARSSGLTAPQREALAAHLRQLAAERDGR